jgi:GR25 family glycosyltransferase involved in LPS biosynthesis
MVDQLEQLAIADYQFIDAVDGKDITGHASYNPKIARRINRELTLGEIGCALSHRAAYQSIADHHACGIILEDDAILSDEFAAVVRSDVAGEFDCVFFGYHTSNGMGGGPKTYSAHHHTITQGTIAYFDNHTINIGEQSFYKFNKQSYEVDFLHGGYAYMISNKFANRLLRTPIVVQADSIWNYHHICPSPNLYGAAPVIVGVNLDGSDLDQQRRLAAATSEHSAKWLQRISRGGY